MNLDILSHRAEFDSLEAEWNALFTQCARPSPYLLHGWLSAKANQCSCSLAICTLRRGGTLCAALPLFIERRAGVRIARHLSGAICTPVDILADSRRAASDLWEAIHHADELWDASWLEGVSAGGNLARIDDLALNQVDVEPGLLMPDGWLSACSSESAIGSVRVPGRRQLRRLSSIGKIEFVCAQSAEELDAALQVATRLHALRWKRAPDASQFATENSQKFHRDFLRRIGETGIARIVLLKLDGRAIAFDFFFVVDSVMYAYRTAYDPHFARYSPGLLVVFEAAAIASRAGATEIWWGRGCETYKTQFANHFRPVYEVRCSTSSRGRLWSLGRQLRGPVDDAIRGDPRIYRAYLAAVRVVGRS
jgi:CelD/BcsL family acetyltransferase involved in cellulose biosynthesis